MKSYRAAVMKTKGGSFSVHIMNRGKSRKATRCTGGIFKTRADAEVHRDEWARKTDEDAQSLFGRTKGAINKGRPGQRMSKREERTFILPAKTRTGRTVFDLFFKPPGIKRLYLRRFDLESDAEKAGAEYIATPVSERTRPESTRVIKPKSGPKIKLQKHRRTRTAIQIPKREEKPVAGTPARNIRDFFTYSAPISRLQMMRERYGRVVA